MTNTGYNKVNIKDNNKLQKALNEFIESLKKSNKEFAET